MWFHMRWVVGIEADAWWCGSEQISVDCMAGSRCDMTGLYFLRNFLFRKVTMPEPSTRMTHTYWSNCRALIKVLVLSHFVGCGPI